MSRRHVRLLAAALRALADAVEAVAAAAHDNPPTNPTEEHPPT